MTDRYLHETYRMTPRNTALFDASERPADEITVKIRLKSTSLVLKDLNKKLTPDNMTASQDGKNKNAIVVRGTPPDGSYGEDNILKVVKNFDKGASIIR